MADNATMRDWLTCQVGELLGTDPGGIDSDELLATYGLDSVHAAQLCSGVEQRWAISVEPTAAWDHPTIAELADHLVARLSEESCDDR